MLVSAFLGHQDSSEPGRFVGVAGRSGDAVICWLRALENITDETDTDEIRDEVFRGSREKH